jgi:hypothetical protein
MAACGGKVVVDGAYASTGGSGASGPGACAAGACGGASGTGVATGESVGGSSAANTTSVGTGIEVPDGGGPAGCSQDYYNLVLALETSLGCTPGSTHAQCTGGLLLHDPCGCLHVANVEDPPPPDPNGDPDPEYTTCVNDGCCGPTVAGCATCPPAPTSGTCDDIRSQCVGN